MRRLLLSVLRKSISLAFFLVTVVSELLCAQEYSFRSFGVAEGLTNLTIRRIFEDRVGFIWVSTENGIFRYDGDRFEPFGAAQGIPSNSGAAFGDAPDGSLLAGGNFGLYHLSGNRFEKLTGPFKYSQLGSGNSIGRQRTHVFGNRRWTCGVGIPAGPESICDAPSPSTPGSVRSGGLRGSHRQRCPLVRLRNGSLPNRCTGYPGHWKKERASGSGFARD